MILSGIDAEVTVGATIEALVGGDEGVGGAVGDGGHGDAEGERGKGKGERGALCFLLCFSGGDRGIGRWGDGKMGRSFVLV